MAIPNAKTIIAKCLMGQPPFAPSSGFGRGAEANVEPAGEEEQLETK
jgi:hypothetical protein